MMIDSNKSDAQVQKQVQKTSSPVPVVIAVSPETDTMALWQAALQATKDGQCVYFINEDGWVTEPEELKRITEYSGCDQQSSLLESYQSSEDDDLG